MCFDDRNLTNSTPPDVAEQCFQQYSMALDSSCRCGTDECYEGKYCYALSANSPPRCWATARNAVLPAAWRPGVIKEVMPKVTPKAKFPLCDSQRVKKKCKCGDEVCDKKKHCLGWDSPKPRCSDGPNPWAPIGLRSLEELVEDPAASCDAPRSVWPIRGPPTCKKLKGQIRALTGMLN